MRQLKFRAWDEQNKVYENPNEVCITSDGSVSVYDGDDNGWICADGALIIEQFTGLLDKNGKEIYENDIVRCKNGHIGIVIWEEHDACFNVTGYRDESNHFPTMAFFEGQPFEILGNIHENPELLGAQ